VFKVCKDLMVLMEVKVLKAQLEAKEVKELKVA
jgi:hypothetical protein